MPEYQLIRSARRTLALQINPEGQLIVRAPRLAPKGWIEKFVQEKEDWIQKKQAQIQGQKTIPKQFMPGEKFLYLGNHYELFLTQERVPLIFDEGFYLSEMHHPSAKDHFIKWYKQQAKKEITERVEGFAALANLKFNNLKITSARSRWGSCSGKNNLNFSWRLIMAPIKVVDYVVAHELAHIEEKNHSRYFWDKVAEICPDYEPHKKWLRKNGHLLNL